MKPRMRVAGMMALTQSSKQSHRQKSRDPARARTALVIDQIVKGTLPTYPFLSTVTYNKKSLDKNLGSMNPPK